MSDLSEHQIYEDNLRIRSLELVSEIGVTTGGVHNISDFVNTAELIYEFIKNEKKAVEPVILLTEDSGVIVNEIDETEQDIPVPVISREGEWDHFVQWVRRDTEDFDADKWKKTLFHTIVNSPHSSQYDGIMKYSLPRNSGVTTFLAYLAAYMLEFGVYSRPVKFVLRDPNALAEFDDKIRNTVYGVRYDAEEISISTADEYWKYSPKNIIYVTDNCTLKYGQSNTYQRSIEISNV